MPPLYQSLVLLPLLLLAWVFLFVAWLGAYLKGEPTWVPWLSVCSAVLLLGGGVALFLRGPTAIVVKRVFLRSGGIGLAVILIHLLMVEPYQRKAMQANNNRLLYEKHVETALARVDCPSGSMLVVVPGITIMQGESARPMLELYWLPPNPSQRAIKVANTRYDGSVVETPDLHTRLPDILGCFESPQAWQALLQQMGEGMAAFESRGREGDGPF